MKKLARLLIAIMSLLAFPAQAIAQDEDDPQAAATVAEPDEGQRICVGGQYWHAEPEDLARIEAVPVPASFRRLAESDDGCVRSGLDRRGLVDWHISFGSERSVAAALVYLAEHTLTPIPPPERYAGEIRRAWRASRADLQRAWNLAQRHDRETARRVRQQNPAYLRLDRLLEDRRQYHFLADQYLRAAAAFESLDLLTGAERYIRGAIDAALFLAPLEEQPPAVNQLHFNLHLYITDAQRAFSASLRAHITRTPQDIAAAEAVLGELNNPLYEQAARHAYHGGDGFCDFDEDDQRLTQLAETCREDDGFPARVTSYWFNRTMLDLIKGSSDTSRHDLAIRLLEFERVSGVYGLCCLRAENPAILALHLAAAQTNAGIIGSQLAANHPYDARLSWTEALQHYRQAERMVTPFNEPNRFRRIAQAWLAVWARREELRPAPIEEYGEFPRAADRRYAAYLRRTLDQLESIATGAER